MSATTIQIIPEVPAAESDAGFGALSTARGNLPLTSLDVSMSSTGLACRTELVQGFTNPCDEPLEATYIFPLPDRAAVTSLRLEAADRVVEGVLSERGQARKKYDEALARGQRVAIAEEERPGVFTMRVGNILPGENVKVRLEIISQLPYEDGVATMRFPLVVAPRYIPGVAIGGEDVGSGVAVDTDAVPDASRITPPVLLPGFANPVRLSITAEIDPAGLPIGDIASSLHAVSVEALDAGRVRVRVHPGEHPDRDFILRMRLGAEDAVTHTLSVASDGTVASTNQDIDVAALGEIGTGTFALTVLPPRASKQARPRDVVLVLDRSGSMGGWKMVAARRAAGRIVDTLTSHDRFAVLTFDDVCETPPSWGSGLLEASDRNRFRAVEFLAKLEARGGTETLGALETAWRVFTAPYEGQRERALVLVTDGQVGNEDQVLRHLASKLGLARIHAVGIDTAVNASFLQRLASATGGRCELVESEDGLDRAMDAIHSRIGTPLITDLDLDVEGLAVIEDTLTPRPLPALYAGAPVVITGRFRGDPAGAVGVRGKASDGTDWRVRIDAGKASAANLAPVWARSRLRDLEDTYARASGRANLSQLERKIVATSLRFGVLSRFTAFTAIDVRVVNEGGSVRRVTQPIELPAGWSGHPFGATRVAGRFAESSPVYGQYRYTDLQDAAPAPFVEYADDASLDGMVAEALPLLDWKPSTPAPPHLFGEARRLISECLEDLRASAPEDRYGRLDALIVRLNQMLTRSEAGFDERELRAVRELTVELASLLAELPRLEKGQADGWRQVMDLLGTFPARVASARPRRAEFWRRGG